MRIFRRSQIRRVRAVPPRFEQHTCADDLLGCDGQDIEAAANMQLHENMELDFLSWRDEKIKADDLWIKLSLTVSTPTNVT